MSRPIWPCKVSAPARGPEGFDLVKTLLRPLLQYAVMPSTSIQRRTHKPDGCCSQASNNAKPRTQWYLPKSRIRSRLSNSHWRAVYNQCMARKKREADHHPHGPSREERIAQHAMRAQEEQRKKRLKPTNLAPDEIHWLLRLAGEKSFHRSSSDLSKASGISPARCAEIEEHFLALGMVACVAGPQRFYLTPEGEELADVLMS